MAAFHFRLQRVLDYRRSLVEAQEAHLGQCARALADAQRHLATVRQRQQDLVSGLRRGAGSTVDVDRVAIAWQYLGLLQGQESAAEGTVRSRQAELVETRAKLTELKKQEQVIAKLRDRLQVRAEVAARRQEAKELDDLTSIHHRLIHGEVN